MDKKMKLVFASNNTHKLTEVREIMPTGVEVLSLKDIGFNHEIEETGTTLAENSAIKARTVYQWLQNQGRNDLAVFADDTGLEIDTLDGAPGVYTARWYKLQPSAENGCPVDENTDLSDREVFKANRIKALRELEGKENRGCQFKTVITLIRRNSNNTNQKPTEVQVEGIVRGIITTAEHGEGGFGYDPIFIPDGYDKTFGELPAEVKNHISHRAKALEALRNYIG